MRMMYHSRTRESRKLTRECSRLADLEHISSPALRTAVSAEAKDYRSEKRPARITHNICCKIDNLKTGGV